MEYKNTKKGAQGIGTLIIFIALILVAAVAAGVLIQTASSLQSKSLDVGRQSQEKITTSIEVVQVTAQDTSDGNINATSDSFRILVRLGAGSTPIKLEDLTIAVDTDGGSQSVAYNPALGVSTTNFAINYLSNNNSPQNQGYLVNGDLVRMEFNSSFNVGEQESATITLLSRNGAPQPIDITTPSAMIRTVTPLYP